MDSGRPDDDPMRIYQVFQNSFNKIGTKDQPAGSFTPATAGAEMDSSQFGFASAPPGASSEGFASPESPYFPFGANPRGQRAAKVEKDAEAAVWYGDEFVQTGGATRLPSYQQAGAGQNQDSYFGLQSDHGAAGPPDWQSYGAYGQFGGGAPSVSAAAAVAGHLDSMLYGGGAAAAGAADVAAASAYCSTPGTPTVASPAPYTTAVGGSRASGQPGLNNLDDAINVLRNM